MGRLVISGGHVVDPTCGIDQVCQVTIEDGQILAITKTSQRSSTSSTLTQQAHEVLDATGLWVVPGLIDLHVHLRQPGNTEAETIASGSRAAASGGFTAVVCMPNTQPVLDRAEVVSELMQIIQREALVGVFPAAALSHGLQGLRASDLDSLVKSGAVALSDDGVGTRDPQVLAQALDYSQRTKTCVMVHAEDKNVSVSGVLRSGPVARRAGLVGYSAQAETRRVLRDISILKKTGGHLHLQHLSTVGALNAVRRAKDQGLNVTCEVTPHHFTLCDEDIPDDQNPNFKMNPPLGRPYEREALRQALADGTVDAIATDHAPHTESKKRLGFTKAPFGVIGLETALPLSLRLYHEGLVDRMRLIELLSLAPARILGIEAGSLEVGKTADITILDPQSEWVVDPDNLYSLSKNSPFVGWTMKGKAVYTLVGGKVVRLDS